MEERRKLSDEEIASAMKQEDWRVRYAALDVLEPTEEHTPLLRQALEDPKMQIRRLAVVYLGDLRTSEAMELLYQAMQDDAPAVRRTAGDTLSDIGDAAATPVMVESLKDSSKIVRWRAARFLYEVGTEDARSALEAAADDPSSRSACKHEWRLNVSNRVKRRQEPYGSRWRNGNVPDAIAP